MQLSVIILNYNVRYFLEQCVGSVQKAIQNLDAEIIVVDNHSSDESCAMMQQLFPNVKLIQNKENFGFPKGNNIGVAEAKGEYICILNPDTVVAEDTFEKILNPKNWKLNTGIIGCKLIDGTGNFLPESKRGIPTPWVAFTKIFKFYKLFPKSKLFNQYYAQEVKENQSGKVDILVGAFMVMTRKLYQELKGFDENCFMYADDIDLSYRALMLQKENYFFHETTVIHYKGESTVRDEIYMERFQEAMNYFYKKHFRKSFLFDLIMKLGSFLFSLVKSKQQHHRLFVADETIFFSKNNFEIPVRIDNFFENLNDFTSIPILKYEIIFDTSSFSFTEIIRFMEQNKSKNLVFKNYLPTSNFIIGSNHANDLGVVVNLSKLQ